MPGTIRRRSPEELLQQAQAEEEYEQRGRLKVFLGYASGVGKSFRMLDEGRRRRERGQDVVVGAIQPTLPPEIEAVLGKLEVIPLRMVDGVGVMDVAAFSNAAPRFAWWTAWRTTIRRIARTAAGGRMSSSFSKKVSR